MRPRPTALVLLGAVLPLSCGAPAPPPEELPRLVEDPGRVSEGLPDARSLIERHLEATNMLAVAEGTRSMWARGRVRSESPEAEGVLEVWRAKPDLLLARMDFGPYGEVRTGYDGEVAWTLHPFQGPLVHRGQALLQMRERAAYDQVVKSPERFSLLRTRGREEFGGEDCWEIQCVLADPASSDPGPTRDVRTFYEYYSVDSGMYVGSLALRESSVGVVRETSYVRERERWGGALLPTRTIHVQEAPRARLEIEIDEVRFDVVDEDVFALPPEIVEELADAAGGR